MTDHVAFINSLPTKAIFKKEYRYFRLCKRRVNSPSNFEDTGLKHEVCVLEQREDLTFAQGVYFVDYSMLFASAVARRMPMGAGPHQPVYLVVIKSVQHPLWQIVAVYKEWKSPLVLWRQAERPEWLSIQWLGIKVTK